MDFEMRKKPKRKDKGKKLYRNTHGTWYRVRLGYRLRRKIEQRKLREVNEKKITKNAENAKEKSLEIS